MLPLVAVDYDGTICENAWPEHGDFKPGAIEALKEIQKHARIVIHTARTSPMELDGFTERPRQVVLNEVAKINARLFSAGLRGFTVWQGQGKPGAIVFIDDRAIRFNDRPGAWKAITQKVLIKVKAAPDLFPEYIREEV